MTLRWQVVLVIVASSTTREGLWGILQASSFSEEVYPSDDRAYRIVVPASNAGYADLQGALEDAFTPNESHRDELTRAREMRRSKLRLGRIVSHRGIETKLPRNPQPLLDQLRQAGLLVLTASNTSKRRLVVVPPLERFGEAADIVSKPTERRLRSI